MPLNQRPSPTPASWTRTPNPFHRLFGVRVGRDSPGDAVRPNSREPSSSTSHSRLPFALGISLLLALATFLRIVALGRKSFWLDEAASSMLARSDWHTFVTALLQREANMALYYLLLRGWIHVGTSEACLRLLSVVFGVAAVPIMYQLGQALFGTKTARIAAFLMTIHVFHIQYSQEARGYALVVFLALLSSYFFVRLLPSATKTTQAAYILASILTVYAHVFGAWILPAQWACALFLPNAAPVKRTVCIAAGIISVFLSPLVFSLLFVSDRSQLSWMTQDTASSLYHFLLDLSGNAGSPLLVLYLVLLLVSLRSHFRSPQPLQGGATFAYVFLWAWLLLPTFIVGSISLHQPILQVRYLIVCLPPFLILAADGLAHIGSRPIFVAALMAMAGLSLVGVKSYYKARGDLNHIDNWRDATRYCLSQAQSGDAVLFTYSAEEIPFREYQDRLGRRASDITLVPQETDLELLSTVGTWASAPLASSTAAQHHRVWVLTALQPNAHSAEAQAALRTRLKEESRWGFGFVTTQLFVSANRAAR